MFDKEDIFPQGHYTLEEATNVVITKLGLPVGTKCTNEQIKKFFKESEHGGYYLPISPQCVATSPHIPKPEPSSGHWGAVKY